MRPPRPSIAHLELDPVGGCKLSGHREVRRNHGRNLGIATRGLAIGHQQDRLSRRGDLDRPDRRSFGQHVGAGTVAQARTREAIPHPV